MGTITALTAQKRNNDRINVFLDGAFAFGLAAVVAAHLKVGQSLTTEMITSLQEEDSVEKAREKALNLITYRPRSVAEVERKLRDKGFDESVTTRAIERLQAVDLLDDMTFARYWVEQRETFKPRSRLALQQELREKGVARSVIETVLSDIDETAAARRAAQKQLYRWSNLAEAEFREKLGGFLQRRGFHYEVVQEITEELWAGTMD